MPPDPQMANTLKTSLVVFTRKGHMPALLSHYRRALHSCVIVAGWFGTCHRHRRPGLDVGRLKSSLMVQCCHVDAAHARLPTH